MTFFSCKFASTTPKILRRAAILALGVGIFSPFSVILGQNSAGQLVIFLEKISPPKTPFTLHVTRLTLTSASDSLNLPLLLTDVSSDTLTQRQVLLSQSSTIGGTHPELRMTLLELSEVDAETSHALEAVENNLRIPLAENWIAENAVFVFLKYVPTDSSTKQVPRFVQIHKRLPPLSAQAFVSNEGSDNVMILDRLAGEIVGGWQVGQAPRGMALAKQSNTLFIANSQDNTISVIDLHTRRLRQTMNLDPADEPEALCLNRDETRLFCANRGSNSWTVLDTRSLNVLSKIEAGAAPVDIEVDPEMDRIYLANSLSDEVMIFNSTNGTYTLTSSLQAGSFPTTITVDPRSQTAFVANFNSGEITQINTQTVTVTGRFSVGRSLSGLVMEPFSRTLYGALQNLNLVIVFQPALSIEMMDIPVPAGPTKITLDPERNYLYVTCTEAGVIAIINRARGRVDRSLATGLKPYEVIFP